MSKIHYFQRYSSVENTVTNNTLQLFSRIYDYSVAAASRFLTDLTGEPIDIGIEIIQQGRFENSIPDGAIIQRSFKILIEAKVDSPVNSDQLLRHAGTFGDEAGTKILILLTRQANENQEEELAKRIHQEYPEVIFKNVTYEDICKIYGGLFESHESGMIALVNDYMKYCNDEDLFDQSRYLLRIVPCGQSVRINQKYGVYFQPSDRGYTQHSYVGIYANKSVQSVLKIESVFDVILEGERLLKTVVLGDSTDIYDESIRLIIRDALEECGYEISSGHRFFCGPMLKTDFKKTTSGGIMGARLLNLRNLLGDFSDLEDITAKLRDKSWE